MKSIFFAIVVLISSQNLVAQTNIKDSSTHFGDSIYARRNYYIGKPLGVLLDDLKGKIFQEFPKYDYSDGLPDSVLLKELVFDFTREKLYVEFPFPVSEGIAVKLMASEKIPAELFRFQQLLSRFGSWNNNKYGYYKNSKLIVSDLRPQKVFDCWSVE